MQSVFLFFADEVEWTKQEELSPMTGKVVLKSLLKKRAQRFDRYFKTSQKPSGRKAFGELLIEGNRLRQFLLFNPSYFSRRVLEENCCILETLSVVLESVRSQTNNHQLAVQFFKDGKTIGKRKAKDLIGEIQTFADRSVQETAGQLKKMKAKKIGMTVMRDFRGGRFSDLEVLVQTLEEKRKALFEQIVQMIRASDQNNLRGLKKEIEDFCYALELAVDAGFQKGRRLLHALELLNRRLSAVCDKETFRVFIEELAKSRASDAEKVVDVQRIRAGSHRLGMIHAHTIKMFHSQIPMALRILKKPLI